MSLCFYMFFLFCFNLFEKIAILTVQIRKKCAHNKYVFIHGLHECIVFRYIKLLYSCCCCCCCCCGGMANVDVCTDVRTIVFY